VCWAPPYVAMPSSAEAVSPRIVARSASLKLGCASPGACCVSDDLGRALVPHQLGEVYMRLEGLPDFTYHGRGTERRTVERGGFISAVTSATRMRTAIYCPATGRSIW